MAKLATLIIYSYTNKPNYVCENEKILQLIRYSFIDLFKFLKPYSTEENNPFEYEKEEDPLYLSLCFFVQIFSLCSANKKDDNKIIIGHNKVCNSKTAFLYMKRKYKQIVKAINSNNQIQKLKKPKDVFKPKKKKPSQSDFYKNSKEEEKRQKDKELKKRNINAWKLKQELQARKKEKSKKPKLRGTLIPGYGKRYDLNF